jgi:hypothetical protein
MNQKGRLRKALNRKRDNTFLYPQNLIRLSIEGHPMIKSPKVFPFEPGGFLHIPLWGRAYRVSILASCRNTLACAE